MRATLEAGLAPAGASPDALRVSKDVARARRRPRSSTLRAALTEWFTFYNGYDPLFTWWNGLPYKKADAALQALRRVPARRRSRRRRRLADRRARCARVSRSRRRRRRSSPRCPICKELIALPQDEMTDIVQRFRGARPRRSVRGVGRGAAGRRPAARPRAFYEAWLKALKTLDFDKLSRNAQVDYLYIKKMAEQQIARAGVTLPDNPPRKTDASGITGQGARPAGPRSSTCRTS